MTLGAPSIDPMDDLANKVIDSLGGTSAVARLCEIKVPSVSEWRHNGIPKPWKKFLMCKYPDLMDRVKARDQQAA